MFDEDPKTYWLESKDLSLDRYVGMVFADPVAVDSVELVQYSHENYRVVRAELEWSDDGETWTQFAVADLDGKHCQTSEQPEPDGVCSIGNYNEQEPKIEKIPNTDPVDYLDFF